LPGAGKCPPPVPSLCALFVVVLRGVDFPAALLSAATKSLPSVLCAGVAVGRLGLMSGMIEITGIGVIPVEIASHVPSLTSRPTIA
jgi:hypothetical protein